MFQMKGPFDLLKSIPIVNLAPMVVSVIDQIPKGWEALPEEKKKEIVQNLLIAAAKAAAKG